VLWKSRLGKSDAEIIAEQIAIEIEAIKQFSERFNCHGNVAR
jgi:hypothetical protein